MELGAKLDLDTGSLTTVFTDGDVPAVICRPASAKHDIINRLRPDVDLLQPQHVVVTADRTSLESVERPSAGTGASREVGGPVAGRVANQRRGTLAEGRHHDLALLARRDMRARFTVDDFGERNVRQEVHDARLPVPKNAVLAGDRERPLAAAVDLEESRVPPRSTQFGPGARPASAADVDALQHWEVALDVHTDALSDVLEAHQVGCAGSGNLDAVAPHVLDASLGLQRAEPQHVGLEALKRLQ